MADNVPPQELFVFWDEKEQKLVACRTREEVMSYFPSEVTSTIGRYKLQQHTRMRMIHQVVEEGVKSKKVKKT